MRPETLSVDVPVVVSTAGAGLVSDRFIEKVLQFSDFVAGGGGTWKIQGSLDGTGFADISGAVMADGFVAISQYAKMIRLYCVVAPGAPATGPTVKFGGLDVRAV